MNPPRVSALFSTFNRAPLLRKALEGLLHQTLHRDEFEVVVVDDGSSDDTESVVREFERSLQVKYMFQENMGLAAGKNTALHLAQAPLVVFMDDDDIPGPNLLEEHLSTHLKYPEEFYAVLGHTNLDDSILNDFLMHYITQIGCFLFCYPRIKHDDILDYTYFWGGRSSCKKDFLIKNGIFDPIFKFGCEDIELGYRLSKNGLKVVYNKNALSTMIRKVSLHEFCNRAEKQGFSNWIFSQLHPTKEIESWCMTQNIDSDWEHLGKHHAILMKSALDLDEIARIRKNNGLELDETTTHLLHQSYLNSINAHRIKGSYEAKMSSICRTTQ